MNIMRSGHIASLPNCLMTCWLKLEAAWETNTSSAGSCSLCVYRNMALMSQHLTVMCVETLLGPTHGFLLGFHTGCLTFQHFHSHLCAGLGMTETISGCLDHPAKGSWSKSATWNTKIGSVGRGVNATHGRPEKERFLFTKIWTFVFQEGKMRDWLEQIIKDGIRSGADV